jgi:hypothetical protein
MYSTNADHSILKIFDRDGSFSIKKKLLLILRVLSFSSREKVNSKKRLKIFPARESLVSEIPSGDGKNLKPFLQCILLRTGKKGTRIPSLNP